MTASTPNDALKQRVRAHWQEEACGTRYGESGIRQAWFEGLTKARYELEPYILSFAEFQHAQGKRVLEIGVGAGADFCNWVANGAIADGIDLTETAISLTQEHLTLRGLDSQSHTLRTADAESLPFEDNQFDQVYSWGVLHHTPHTEHAFEEAYRVLRPGGVLKAMVYHRHSWVCLMLWVRYALLTGKPSLSVKEVVFRHLESPGTKVYTIRDSERMLSRLGFEEINTETKLSPGDLLSIKPSEKYAHPLYGTIWKLYPRWLVRILGNRFGLHLLIQAIKPQC